jgi:membrane-bound metal-dependent hydrolase YbcI (DUF457 family)
MFIGHFAPALIAATHPRSPGLGTLFVAAQLVDWAFFGLLLAGIEHMRLSPGISVMNPMDLYHMPYTHSLLGTALFAVLFGGAIYLWRRDRVMALIGGLVIVSHWFLDYLVHIPDLTLFGAPPKLGLGLWDKPAIAMPLELGLTLGAIFFYLIRTRAVKSSARLAIGTLALVLLTVQVVNWFGPEPSGSTTELALTAFTAFALLTLIATWTGTTRRLSEAAGT